MQPLFPVSLLVAYLNGCIMEIWKDVPGYVGLYQDSKIGILNGKSKAVIRFSMNNKLIDEFESINIALILLV